jgi:hypothetical protein
MADTYWLERPEISAALTKRLAGFLAGYRQNIALIGPEAVGKTTFLKRMLQKHAMSAAPLIVYLEIQEQESFGELAARFIETLLRTVVRVGKVDGSSEGLLSLVRLCGDSLPKTAALAQKLLRLSEEKRSGEELFNQLWDMPQLVTQETGLPCLLVIDEFHRLSRFKVKDPFKKLGQRIMVQSGTMYLLVSSHPQAAREILREGLSLLFGQFEVIEMGPLDAASSLKALRTSWATEGADPFLEYVLVELVQGYPVYLDLLLQGIGGRPLPHLAEDQERSVLDLLETLLLDPSGVLRHRFESRLKVLPVHRSRRTWVQALVAVASGCHRESQVAQAIERNESQALRALKVLESYSLIVKQGVFYRVPDRLFRFWLMTAYPILQGTVLSDMKQASVAFRQESGNWIRKVREAMHRPLEEQGIAFVRQWAGEQVEIEGKRTLLPKLDRVESVSIGIERPMIVAHPKGGEGKSWLLIPWAGALEESQARQLVEELSKTPLRDCRKIVAGAQPVELNARLVLQEGKVRLWDLGLFNNLLELYGLTPIPLPPGPPPKLASTVNVPKQALFNDAWFEQAT